MEECSDFEDEIHENDEYLLEDFGRMELKYPASVSRIFSGFHGTTYLLIMHESSIVVYCMTPMVNLNSVANGD